MPLVGDIWEAYKTSEFVVVVDGVESPGFNSASGLGEGMLETSEQADGGSHRVRKVSGGTLKFDTLTLVRYVDGSPEDQRFLDWWKETFNYADGKLQGSRVRKSLQIIKKDHGVPVLTFLVFDAWIKSSKFSDLEAGSDSLMTQTIELEHEGMERIPA